jgi:hypothetical protein
MCGEENNRLVMRSDIGSQNDVYCEAMLRSFDVKAIVDALSSDILEYVEDINRDQLFGNSVLKTAATNIIAALK